MTKEDALWTRVLPVPLLQLSLKARPIPRPPVLEINNIIYILPFYKMLSENEVK